MGRARKAQVAQRKRAQERKLRLQDPKTASAHAASSGVYSDEEDDGVNAGASEPSSDPRDVAECEGRTPGLDRDITDASSRLRSGSAAEADAQPADMDADQSREEDSKHLRDVARQLQGESAEAPMKRRKGGQLVKPSPALRAKRATMRKRVHLGQRPWSAYDEFDDSPEKRAPPARHPADVTAFSPRKKQGKAQKAQQQARPSPSRSGPQQADRDGTNRAVDAASVPQQDEPQPGEHATDDAMYIDRFPDAVVQRYARTGTDVDGAAASDDSRHVFSAVPNQTSDGVVSIEPAAAPATPRAKRSGNSSQRSSARAQRRLPELAQEHTGRDAPDSSATSQARPQQSVKSQVESRQRRSTHIEQRLAELNRRRTMEVNGVPAEKVTTDAEVADHPEHEKARKILPEKPIIPRLSEVRFSNVNGAQDNEDVEEEASDLPVTRKGKRKATARATQANTGAKRRKQSQREADDDVDEDEQEESEKRHEANKRRFWGQWLALRKIYRNLEWVGCNIRDGERTEQNEIDLEDEDVRAAVELCKDAKKRYKSLMEGASGPESEPASVLREIGRRVDGLRGHDAELPTDFKDKTKSTNIYFHLIPALFRLVWRAIVCYETLDKDDVPAGEISMTHLQIILGIIRLVLDMESAARTLYEYAKPDTNLAVVKSVHNGIAVPLRQPNQALQIVVQRHHAEVQETQRRQQEAQDRALRLEQEERRSRQAAELSRVREKWEQLHRERMFVEGNFIRPAKLAHLKMPDPNLDEDFAGAPFRRVSIFHPRVGPPPGLMDRAKQIVWTQGELRALIDGLSMYPGKMVFEKTFREWCPRGMILNKYNVMEILAAAEGVKTYFEAEAAKEGVQAEEWVRLIPVWSKSHALGKENEELADNTAGIEEGEGSGHATATVASSSRT